MLLFKQLLINSIVLYIIPSADASCEYSKGKIINIDNSYAITVIDLEDNNEYELRAMDIIRFDKYDIIKYSIKYCELDCIVLKEGYEKFKKWMKQTTCLNTDQLLTSASLANKYLESCGCYDGCYKLSGTPRAFIQKCIVGGRTMCNSNKKWK